MSTALDLKYPNVSSVEGRQTMPDQNHVERLRRGAMEWSQWREENRNVTPDLRQAELQGWQLAFFDLSGADLREARLAWADLRSANLTSADLRGVFINDARAPYANFSNSKMQDSYLWGSDFREAIFRGSDLSGANLMCSQLVRTDFSDANLTGCKVYGISAWEVKLEGATQEELVVCPPDQLEESGVRVDNLHVAQFVFLLLEHQNVVLRSVTERGVLLLAGC
jgi:uncharacterized protein YjbI with pentapeptide repeats